MPVNVVGTLLLVFPFVLPRLVAIALSADGFEFRFAEQIAEKGAEAAARTIDHTELAALADAYGTIRSILRGEQYENARIAIQDLLVDRAEALSESESFDPSELQRLFPRATPVERVLILGLMTGNTTLAAFNIIEMAIREKETNNEQYHALVLAEKCWERLSPSERAAIRALLHNLNDGSGARREVADRILAQKT